MNGTNSDRFLIRRSNLTTLKLFVEFYLPKYQNLLERMHQGPYPVKSLGKVSKRIFDGPFGSNRKVDMYQDSGIPYVRVKDVLPEGIVEEGLTYISAEKHQELNRSRVVPGNVLLTIAGRLGTAAVFPDHLKEGNITGHIAGIELPKTVNPHYLATVINSYLGQFQVERWGHRTTRPELNILEIKQIEIPLPPRPIQDHIAAVMQDAYAQRREKLAAAEGLLGGIEAYFLNEISLSLSELEIEKKHFTITSAQIIGNRFDLDLYNTRYTGLISLLKEKFSRVSPLKAISHPITSGATPLGSTYTDRGVPFLRVQNIKDDGSIDLDDILFVSEQFAKTISRGAVQNGDILLVIVGATIGKSAVTRNIESLTVTNQAIARIRVRHDKEINPDFLQIFLSSAIGQIQINALKRPVAQGNLSLTEAGQILVPIINLQKQEMIIAEVVRRRTQAAQLRQEAETVVTEAKAWVERMILGEETP